MGSDNESGAPAPLPVCDFPRTEPNVVCLVKRSGCSVGVARTTVATVKLYSAPGETLLYMTYVRGLEDNEC